MKFQNRCLLAFLSLVIISCDTTNEPQIDTPASYDFSRNGVSTVSFSGQTTRILMATELTQAMIDFDATTEQRLLQMYRNQTAEGGDANPYNSAELNAATKSVKSKVAASTDYFSAKASVSAEIKNQFEEWMSAQVNEVFPNKNTLAEPGVAGQIADGSSARYVNAKGFEYNQMVGKSLIGALMTDQILNNYLSEEVLDAGTNRADNTNTVLVEGKNYTTMEHYWDEAFGYLYGTAADYRNPNATIGQDDGFLNKYLGRMDGDSDFSGIAQEIFDAFALGRAAIVAGEYDVRDEQIQIIRENISKIIGVRAVYYLQSGKAALQQNTPNYGTAFHDLSEGFGFIYSLQFTRVPNSNSPYLSREDVQLFINQLMEGNGLWNVTPATLDSITEQIAENFDFTIAQASN